MTPNVDEDALVDPDPWVTAQRLAREKALAGFALRPDAMVVGGDTVVAVPVGDGWEQLAKPNDAEDARRMLSLLSGKEHVVITGLAVRSPLGLSAGTETAHVTFRALEPEEIASYVATGEPMDKAGAYGIQGGASAFVKGLRGNPDCVIGLPRQLLRELLLGK